MTLKVVKSCLRLAELVVEKEIKLKDILDFLEACIIDKALPKYGTHKKTAEMLGLDRRGLDYRINEKGKGNHGRKRKGSN
jgi:transcriptional regulator with PAS, ATPase and Fis domain